MQETAAQPRTPSKAAAAPDVVPSLAFADADSAKKWAKSLLITAVETTASG
jgi:hypothetical protein